MWLCCILGSGACFFNLFFETDDVETCDCVNPTWPVIGGKWNEKETMSIDPRPILPKEIDIESFDKRHGYSTGEEWKVPDVWSASRLNSWIDCGRKGWLSQALFAGADDMPDEELDSRTRGVLIHEVFEGMVEN